MTNPFLRIAVGVALGFTVLVGPITLYMNRELSKIKLFANGSHSILEMSCLDRTVKISDSNQIRLILGELAYSDLPWGPKCPCARGPAITLRSQGHSKMYCFESETDVPGNFFFGECHSAEMNQPLFTRMRSERLRNWLDRNGFEKCSWATNQPLKSSGVVR